MWNIFDKRALFMAGGGVQDFVSINGLRSVSLELRYRVSSRGREERVAIAIMPNPACFEQCYTSRAVSIGYQIYPKKSASLQQEFQLLRAPARCPLDHGFFLHAPPLEPSGLPPFVSHD
jgi:hypothetical protein